MRRRAPRIRVAATGSVEIVDPGLGDLPLLRGIDSGWRVRTAPLPEFDRPRFLALRAHATALKPAALAGAAIGTLWTVHDHASARLREGLDGADGVSLLALKAAIARRLLSACVLCIRRCGADREAGQRGQCGLAREAYVGEHFVHIAEEPPINPSLVLNLRGCALRCRGCQQHALLDPRAPESERLSPALWDALDLRGARSLSLIGGNPDESLASILDFLGAAPADFALPLVWNNNGAMSPEARRLIEGVADVYLPDLKFHEERCAAAYTHVRGYAAAARASIARMVRSGAPVIVRLLLMPGHVDCCHIPSLRWLAALRAPNLTISLRAQYAPDWRVTPRDGALARRITAAEHAQVREAVHALSLPVFEKE